MSNADPASATEFFKNERRELSSGLMVKTACLVEGTEGAGVISDCEIPIPERMNQIDANFHVETILAYHPISREFLPDDMIPGMLIAPAAFRLVIIAVVCFAEPEAKSHELTGKVVHIADGDTLTVLDADKVQHKIRLSGIDAPEKSQAFGTKAKEALAEKVHEKTVRVVWKEKDRYGRIVGEIHLGDRDINREMVHDGFAWWYRQYAPKSKTLEQAEAEAKKEKRGLWHEKDPEPPWEFRRQERERRKQPT